MKTMQEMRSLMLVLQEFYTDVRLLDQNTLQQIPAGASADGNCRDLCYACRHRDRLPRCCAAQKALATQQEQCRLEYYAPDVVQVTARYYEIDSKPYVLELVKRFPGGSVLDLEDSEQLMSALSGYRTKLYRDALTGAYNRRYYEDSVRSLLGPAGVAIMDLDDFKLYNDTYGHPVGDLVLKTAARVILGCLQPTDTLIRYGGDEFLLYLPGVTADVLAHRLEQIRARVHETPVPGYPQLRPSVSIGGVIQTQADPIEAAVKQADRWMYQAKAQKNTVVVADLGGEPCFSGREQLPQPTPLETPATP
mgnify:CR=1 FL=1